MKTMTPEQDDLINNLLRVASDADADVIDTLMVSAGYWWECHGHNSKADDLGFIHGVFKTDEACDVCGLTLTEYRGIVQP